jgi:hypothetical protein
MSQALKLVFKSAVPRHQYSASAGVLQLATAGVFTVTLEAYIARIAEIDKQIAEKTATNEREHQKYLDLRAAKAEGGWTAAEVEQERANARIRVSTRDQLESEKQALESQKQTILADYSNVSWCWRVVGNGLNAAEITHNTSFNRGITQDENEISFPKLLEGGGLCWLEAFREGTDPATGKVPDGLYVKAVGTPAVLRYEWTDYDFNPITKGVAFGSEVLLHVYTGGLFGQEISVSLMDHDISNSNDSLLLQGGAPAFFREVNIYPEKPFEKGKTDVEGALTKVNAAANGPKTENFVQKSIVKVLVDPAWEAAAGGVSHSLKIFAVIRSVRESREFENVERVYLEVNNASPKTEDPNVEYTNNPVQIGEIETDAAVFHPCKYDAIKFAPVPQTAEAPEIVIFDKSRQEAQILTVPIICPDTDHLQDYQLTLTGVELAECRFKNTPQAHEGHTWVVQKKPENFQPGTATNQSLPFKAAFNYHPSNDNTLEGLSVKMLEYIWPAKLPRDNQHPLEVKAQTCRYARIIKVLPYPDVKWTFDLRFGMKGPRVSTHTNLPTDDRRADPTTGSTNSRYSTAQDAARRSGTVNRRGFMIRSEGMELEFQLSLGAEYNKGEKIELAAKYETKIARFLDLLVSLKNKIDKVTNIDAANKGFRNGVRGLGRLLRSPVIGSIDYPVISIGGTWQAAINNQLEVYTTGSVFLKFTPLIKASVSLDLMAAASYVLPLKPAVMAVERAFAAGDGKINFLLTLFGQLDVNFEYMFSNSGGSNLNLTGAIGLKLELSAEIRVNINAVFFEVAGQVSASGVAVTSIEPRASIGHDDKGTFVDFHCDFKGIKLVGTFAATGGGSSVQYEDTYVVVEEVPNFWEGRADLFSAPKQHS